MGVSLLGTGQLATETPGRHNTRRGDGGEGERQGPKNKQRLELGANSQETPKVWGQEGAINIIRPFPFILGPNPI